MKNFKVIFTGIGATTTWFALILQYYLIIHNYEIVWISQTVKFFSYFTILCNFSVALCFTCFFLADVTNKCYFFAHHSVASATAVYITLVGIGYSILLRHLLSPQGWNSVANELLHTTVPILFILYWTLFIPKTNLPWRSIGYWIIFPLAYVLYVLIRGAFSDLYPYPFVDVRYLGYPTVMLNIAGLLISFLFIATAFIFIDRRIKKN